MSNWMRGALSVVLILFAVFLFFHAYKVWFFSQRSNQAPELRLESEKQPVYVGLGSGVLTLGLFLLKGKGFEISQLRKKVLFVVLISVGSLFLSEAYSVWITYQDVFYMTTSAVDALSYIKDMPLVAPSTYLVSWLLQDWQRGVSRPYQILPFFVIVGSILLLIGVLKATQPEKLGMQDLMRKTPSGIPIFLATFLYFYAFYTWIGYFAPYPFYRLLPLVAADPWFVGPLDLWLPYYVVLGSVSLATGLIITYGGFDTQMLRFVSMILSGSIIVFGEFMVFYGYHVFMLYMMEYTWPWFRGLPPAHTAEFARWSLYFLYGLVSFTIGLIVASKALKTRPSKLAKVALSTVLLATGSLLVYDAYIVSLDHYVSFTTASFQWLPLYMAVALISIAAGAIIVYKTFKNSQTYEHKNIENFPQHQLEPDLN